MSSAAMNLSSSIDRWRTREITYERAMKIGCEWSCCDETKERTWWWWSSFFFPSQLLLTVYNGLETAQLRSTKKIQFRSSFFCSLCPRIQVSMMKTFPRRCQTFSTRTQPATKGLKGRRWERVNQINQSGTDMDIHRSRMPSVSMARLDSDETCKR